MRLFTIVIVAVVSLAIVGLGWKTFASGVLTGFDVVVEEGGPAVKQLVNSGKEHLSNTSSHNDRRGA